MFFKSATGASYPVGSIARIHTAWKVDGETPWNGMDQLDVELTDGTVIKVFRHVIDKLNDQTVSSFAANPGTMLVCFDENPADLYLKPVHGWVVTASGKVRPALTHGIFDDPHEAWVIQTADGSITDENAGWWPNLEAYRAYAVDRAVLA